MVPLRRESHISGGTPYCWVKEIVVSKCLYDFNSDPGCLLPSIFLSSLNIEQEIRVRNGMLCLLPWQCRALP